jgi:hypothetical protein
MSKKIARKIDNQYVVEKTGTDDEWYSEDGNNWVNQDGIPVTSQEFLDSSILFVGGDRDGETVK